ncbi:MAG: hypothetical protein QXH07_07465 [Thermoplasmata archaeon]
MCSETIKKVVFLIGAGGSSPFINGLTTEKLTCTLSDICEWEKVISRLKERQNAQTTEYFDNIESCDVMHHAICKIKGLLKNNIQLFKNGDFNFEHLIHLLDKISIYYHSQKASEIGNIDSLLIDFLHNYDNPFYGNSKKIDTKSDYYGWNYVPFLAREIIISRILELWNEEDREEDEKLNQSFFSSLSSECSYNSICIYSLNYDPLLYESLVAFGSTFPTFETGFINPPPSNPKESTFGECIFDKKRFFDAKNILAFMHGHVGFIPGDAIGETKFASCYKNAQEERFKNLVGSSRFYAGTGSKGTHYNTYLVTGLDKMDAFSENPFSAYMHRFVKDLSEADLVILIGVSLNDYHLNSFLVNAIQISKGKIVFVTKAGVKELSKIIEDFNRGEWYNILIRLWATTHDIMTGVVEDLGNVRNNIGKSSETKKIVKFTDNIGIYVDGTEYFYRSRNIKDLLDPNNWVK